jgi:hypothetical protein
MKQAEQMINDAWEIITSFDSHGVKPYEGFGHFMKWSIGLVGMFYILTKVF